MRFSVVSILAGLLVLLTGCATPASRDYTEFRKSVPRSILVLPPINESTDVRATYSVYTTVSRPLAELGYYVFPVAMVDQFMKENGLAMPVDMHGTPVAKLREVFGADAILYIVIERYGTKYQVITSATVVHARAKLVDARTERTLWEGQVRMDNSGQSGVLEALVEQVVNKLMDQAHVVAGMATNQLLTPPGQGLLNGPRHRAFGGP